MGTAASEQEAQAAPAASGKRALRPEDLFRLRMVGDVAVSPDGQAICYLQTCMDRETNAYQSELWVVPVAGRSGEAVRLTYGPGSVAQPRWAPNGRWLAFLSDRDKQGVRQLWVLPTAGVGGEARRLTSGEKSVSDYSWAPDSTTVAFVRPESVPVEARSRPATTAPAEPETARVADDVVTLTRIRYKADGSGYTHDRRNHLWTVTLDGVETRLTDGDHDDLAPAWAPDCQSLAFVSKRAIAEPDFTNATDLWVVGRAGGEPRRLTAGAGPIDLPAWSPDGATIAYVGSDRANVPGANQQLWAIAAAGGEPVCLTAGLDASMGLQVGSDSRAGLSGVRPAWLPDSSALLAVASTRGDSPLWRVPRDGGAPTPLIEGSWQVQSFSLCANGGVLALNLGSSLSPGDVYTVPIAGGEPRQLTEVNADLCAEVALAEPERFIFAGAEGWPIDGWLLPPAGLARGDATRYPLVLEIHGGPHAAYGNSFFFEFQLFASQGWGVLYTNPRGSTTYGERFTMACNEDWGGNDYRDLLAGVDAALARAPWIDPGRLAVTGGSYGGYMTNWIVTQTDRFKVTITERSLCNMVSKWGVSDIGYLGNDLQWGGAPWENPDFYLERSPLTHVRKVTTPLLIIHSERDLRCPIEQAEQLFTALKYLRREVEFVRFPDEGHELSRSGQPLHRLERLRRMVAWFSAHLGAG